MSLVCVFHREYNIQSNSELIKRVAELLLHRHIKNVIVDSDRNKQLAEFAEEDKAKYDQYRNEMILAGDEVATVKDLIYADSGIAEQNKKTIKLFIAPTANQVDQLVEKLTPQGNEKDNVRIICPTSQLVNLIRILEKFTFSKDLVEKVKSYKLNPALKGQLDVIFKKQFGRNIEEKIPVGLTIPHYQEGGVNSPKSEIEPAPAPNQVPNPLNKQGQHEISPNDDPLLTPYIREQQPIEDIPQQPARTRKISKPRLSKPEFVISSVGNEPEFFTNNEIVFLTQSQDTNISSPLMEPILRFFNITPDRQINLAKNIGKPIPGKTPQEIGIDYTAGIHRAFDEGVARSLKDRKQKLEQAKKRLDMLESDLRVLRKEFSTGHKGEVYKKYILPALVKNTNKIEFPDTIDATMLANSLAGQLTKIKTILGYQSFTKESDYDQFILNMRDILLPVQGSGVTHGQTLTAFLKDIVQYGTDDPNAIATKHGNQEKMDKTYQTNKEQIHRVHIFTEVLQDFTEIIEYMNKYNYIVVNIRDTKAAIEYYKVEKQELAVRKTLKRNVIPQQKMTAKRGAHEKIRNLHEKVGREKAVNVGEGVRTKLEAEITALKAKESYTRAPRKQNKALNLAYRVKKDYRRAREISKQIHEKEQALEKIKKYEQQRTPDPQEQHANEDEFEIIENNNSGSGSNNFVQVQENEHNQGQGQEQSSGTPTLQKQPGVNKLKAFAATPGGEKQRQRTKEDQAKHGNQ